MPGPACQSAGPVYDSRPEGADMRLLVRVGVVAGLLVVGGVLVGRASLMPARWPGQAAVPSSAARAAQAAHEEWDDPAVLHVGTERPHATMMSYPVGGARASAATARRRPGSASLNGTWKFHYSPSPAARPVGFERPGFDDTAGRPSPCPATGRCRGSGCRSTATRTTRSPSTKPTRARRTTTTPWARTARRSPCRPTGPAAASSCTSTASTRRSTSGSTGGASATARTAARRPSST